MARVRSVSGTRRHSLRDGWTFAEASPGSANDPGAAQALPLDWLAALVPGTVASSLRALGSYTHGDSKDFDTSDYWFRCTLSQAVSPKAGERAVLHLDGLATLADVWLDGTHLLHCDSMWVSHAIDVTNRIHPESELVIRFASLDARLRQKYPRPRYKTRLVRRQELRFVRTTLLGRMPGWSPRGAPVGPFRSVWLEVLGPAVRANARARVEGSAGIVEAMLQITGRVDSAELHIGGARASLQIEHTALGAVLHGEVRLHDVERWWPHTHGAQTTYSARVTAMVDGAELEIDLGRVGFRTLKVDDAPEGRGFGLVVNDVPIFARGATFTPLDTLSLHAGDEAYRRALLAVRRAGMNMIRLSGTLIYEDDVLFDLCDELGILIWQDLMFANMDYPTGEDFHRVARAEAEHVLDRSETSAALAVVAGGSEVAQQASMLGLDRSHWQLELFEGVLGEVARRIRPDVAYLPSTPWGGVLPFRSDIGVSHYYGVGAYERDLGDARRADVKFAAECLAFSNVPAEAGVDALLRGGESPSHPLWKERVPRDHGSGWDFEDVRDHYVSQLFGVDTTKLRYVDPDRYLALGRVTTGEIMAAVFSEWRRSGSACRGGLVWLLRDLWPGAGFGLLESSGAPKACYFALSRALQPVALLAVDEGLNGARFVATNDSALDLSASIEVTLFIKSNEVRRGARAIDIPGRGEHVIDVEELLGSFADPNHTYRFGPPTCDVIVGKLIAGETGNTTSTAFHFPLGIDSEIDAALELEAVGHVHSLESMTVTVRANRLALFVTIEVRGWIPDDDAFHIEPSGTRVVRLSPIAREGSDDKTPVGSPIGTVQALNAGRAARIQIKHGEPR